MYTVASKIDGAIHSQLSPEVLRQNLIICVLAVRARHKLELVRLHGAICKSPGHGFDLGPFRQTGLDGPRGCRATVLDHELIVRELMVAVQENEVEELLENARPDEVRALFRQGIGRALELFQLRRVGRAGRLRTRRSRDQS